MNRERLITIATWPGLYVVLSYSFMFLLILDSAMAYQDFFPVIVSLSNSSIFKLCGINFILASALMWWLIVKFIFFGQLRLGESEKIISAFPFVVVESVLLYLYDERGITFLVASGSLATVVMRMIHKMAKERVSSVLLLRDANPRYLRENIGVFAFLVIAIMVDTMVCVGVYVRLSIMDEVKEEHTMLLYSTMLLFGQMSVGAARSCIRLVRSVMLGDRARVTTTFYVDSILSLVDGGLYIIFFIYISVVADIPIMLVRQFSTAVYSFADQIKRTYQFRTMQHYLEHIPCATDEDLERESKCTICFDEMESGPGTRRLSCGHCYHDACLRRWLEQNTTCPYCRSDQMNVARDARHLPQPAPQAPAPAAAPVVQPPHPLVPLLDEVLGNLVENAHRVALAQRREQRENDEARLPLPARVNDGGVVPPPRPREGDDESSELYESEEESESQENEDYVPPFAQPFTVPNNQRQRVTEEDVDALCDRMGEVLDEVLDHRISAQHPLDIGEEEIRRAYAAYSATFDEEIGDDDATDEVEPNTEAAGMPFVRQPATTSPSQRRAIAPILRPPRAISLTMDQPRSTVPERTAKRATPPPMESPSAKDTTTTTNTTPLPDSTLSTSTEHRRLAAFERYRERIAEADRLLQLDLQSC